MDHDMVQLTRAFKSVKLLELVVREKCALVLEMLQQNAEGMWERAYYFSIKLQPVKCMRKAVCLKLEHVARVFNNDFVTKLTKLIESKSKKASKDRNTITFHIKQLDNVGIGANYGHKDKTDFGFATKTAKKKQKAAKEYKEETTGIEDRVMGNRFGNHKEMTTYEVDAREQVLMRSSFVAEEGHQATTRMMSRTTNTNITPPLPLLPPFCSQDQQKGQHIHPQSPQCRSGCPTAPCYHCLVVKWC